MTAQFSSPAEVMRHALALARRGIGHVEPNPPVGAVVVDASLRWLGEGWHQRFGGPHAEVHALAQAGERSRGATLYVTLEPCSHHGKTPPCADAVIAAGIVKVVAAMGDPNRAVNGRGFERLRAAGIEVETGLLATEAEQLAAPFVMLMTRQRPYVHAKWAMSLDGRIATRTGESKWISNERAREVVHVLRGRMDAILVGVGTVLADDPLLTARPPGPRVATRIVLDSHGRMPTDCRLCRTADQGPLLVATTDASPQAWRQTLADRGVEVLLLPTAQGRVEIPALLSELGRRRMTNLLVEGGGAVLGTFFDAELIDEYHVFVAPRVIGGEGATAPLAGLGLERVPRAIGEVEVQLLDGDIYVRGRRR